MLRKFICLSAGLAACGIAGTAQAGPKVAQKINVGQRVDPIRIARVYADGTVGEWVDYVSADTEACYGPGYDSMEVVRSDSNDPCGVGKGFMADGAASGGFDPYCNIDGGGVPCVSNGFRWWFGLSYVQGGRRSSGTVANDGLTGPGAACRTEFGWSNALNSGQIDPNGNTIGNTVVVVATYDGMFDQFCGTAEPTFLTGVALDFGPLNASTAGYYYTDADLSGGFELDLPSGDIGVEMQFFYDTGLAQPGLNNQVMLWGPKDADAQGTNAGIVYDDDNGDGEFDAFAECFDYTGAVACPDPAASMVVLSTAGGGACQDFSVNRLIGGQPSTFSVSSAANPNAQFGVIYFLNEAQGLAFAECANNADSNALGELVQCYGGDPRDTLACQGRLNASGEGTCSTPIPTAARGRTVTFVSVVQTATGWCAESFTQTVQ